MKLDDLLDQGAITPEDAQAVRDFADILRKAGPLEGGTATQRAYTRWHLPTLVQRSATQGQ